MLPSMYSIRYKVLFLVISLSMLWLLLKMLPGSQVPADEKLLQSPPEFQQGKSWKSQKYCFHSSRIFLQNSRDSYNDQEQGLVPILVALCPFDFMKAEMVRNNQLPIQLPTKPSITPVEVAVFYEALCPDSRSFFLKQLIPTFEKAHRLITVKLVPYGKAWTKSVGSGYTFSCQHGPTECEANKIHACAIKTVSNTEKLLRYIGCMIDDNLNPTDIGQKCAEDCKVDWEAVSACASSPEGDKLLKLHGDATSALRPSASFIPTILLDKKQDRQPAILKNLLKEVCAKFEMQPVTECM